MSFIEYYLVKKDCYWEYQFSDKILKFSWVSPQLLTFCYSYKKDKLFKDQDIVIL